jgi:hypothetical protein
MYSRSTRKHAALPGWEASQSSKSRTVVPASGGFKTQMKFCSADKCLDTLHSVSTFSVYASRISNIYFEVLTLCHVSIHMCT